MPMFTVSYVDVDEQPKKRTLRADTEAGALSWLLSEYAEEIHEDSPLSVWKGPRPRYPVVELSVSVPDVATALSQVEAPC